MRDTDPEAAMIDKFATTLAAISKAMYSGTPTVQEYDGMAAANSALEEFELLHEGHRLAKDRLVSDELTVTRCFDCGTEFRQHYTQHE